VSPKPQTAVDDFADIIERAQDPRPGHEDPPLLDALTAHVCWACCHAAEAIGRIDRMQDDADR
jgi:hypothetical protein